MSVPLLPFPWSRPERTFKYHRRPLAEPRTIIVLRCQRLEFLFMQTQRTTANGNASDIEELPMNVVCLIFDHRDLDETQRFRHKNANFVKKLRTKA